MKSDLILMFGSLVGATLLALLVGANNTGIALGVGQIAFVGATTFVILRPKP
jgi:hypothetical protein